MAVTDHFQNQLPGAFLALSCMIVSLRVLFSYCLFTYDAFLLAPATYPENFVLEVPGLIPSNFWAFSRQAIVLLVKSSG